MFHLFVECLQSTKKWNIQIGESCTPNFRSMTCLSAEGILKPKGKTSMQKSKQTPEQLQEAEERTTARGLSTFAEKYIEAAMIVDEKQGKRTWLKTASSIPAYFLAAHGVELTFKAFLRHKGMTLAELRSPEVGHDLRQLFRKSKEYRLLDIFRMMASDMRALLLLVQMNEYQGLRYIRSGAKVFPEWQIVEPFPVRLHQAVAPVVGMRSFDNVYSGYPQASPTPQ
jgi:hypothetical protein